MQNHKNQQSKELLPQKAYSNLIFNQQKRAICALSFPQSPLKGKHCSREHSIMLLRKSKRQNYHRDFSSERQSKSVEMITNAYQNNKINVINLMNCSMNTTTPKFKSNYCKKITLTNVDKYYQFCLKKMKSISGGDVAYVQKCQERPLSSTRKSLTPTPLKKTTDSQNCNPLSKQSSSNQITNLGSSRSKDKEQPNLQISEWSYLQGSCSKICQKHHHEMQPPRNIYSSFNLRQKNKGNRRYINSNQQYRYKNSNNKKSQFAIDAWESTDNVDEYIF